MDKPDVDFIEGLSPAISIDQKSASRNPRSTVGTITEIYDYLRLLYARIGMPHCPNCGRVITRQTPQQIVDRVLAAARGHPVPGARAGRARPQGRVRGAARGAGAAGLHPGPDRRRASSSSASCATERQAPGALREAHHRGRRRPPRPPRRASSAASPTRSRPRCAWPRASPRSRSCPRGRARTPSARRSRSPSTSRARTAACRSTSSRRGTSRSTRRTARASAATASAPASRSTPSSSSPTTTCSIADGAIAPWSGFRSQYFERRARRGRRRVRLLGRHAVEEAAEEGRSRSCCYGTGKTVGERVATGTATAASARTPRSFEGVVPWLERRHTESESDRAREQIEGYMREVPCPACGGARLRPASLAVTIGGTNIYEVGELSIREGGRVPRRARAVRARPHDRRAGAEGGQRAAALPARRRPRLPDRSTARRPRSPAARRSASGSRRRSAAASSACSTCSTSRRSGCTSATTSGSSTRWCGCATSATP